MPRSTPVPSSRPLPDGLRSTRASRALLALLKARPDAVLSAADIKLALAQSGMVVNRVTIYRLLSRLAAAGLLRRQVDARRVARFALASVSDDAVAPRFECADCQCQFRVVEGAQRMQNASRQILRALASAGYEDLAVSIMVRGRCAGCARLGEAVA